MPAAVIFDLDETLLDTSALRADRDARQWGLVARRLPEVRTYNVADSVVAVAELPARLRSNGYPVGVLTHSPRWYAERLLATFGIEYDALITGSDSYPRKPDPASLLAMADELGVAATDAMFVGDSDTDVGAAAAAGAPSVGACWSRHAPTSWRRNWPDVVISRPDRLFDVLADGARMAPFGEAVAAGIAPRWHWGSVMRLSDGAVAAGRYFSATDRRHAAHPLSQLVLDAKDDPAAAERVADVFVALAERPARDGQPDVVTSVPPAPDRDYDRFAVVRERLAAAYGTTARGDILTMRRAVDNYKSLNHDERAAANRDRFASCALDGERVLLIDDVLTSGTGGQAESCRAAMLARGAAAVTVVGMTVTQDPLAETCPACGGLLRTINGRNGRFVGCSNWWATGCPYTRNV
jgi:HAD superfamily hydrolase (TIGR01549 family)